MTINTYQHQDASGVGLSEKYFNIVAIKMLQWVITIILEINEGNSQERNRRYTEEHYGYFRHETYDWKF